MGGQPRQKADSGHITFHGLELLVVRPMRRRKARPRRTHGMLIRRVELGILVLLKELQERRRGFREEGM